MEVRNYYYYLCISYLLITSRRPLALEANSKLRNLFKFLYSLAIPNRRSATYTTSARSSTHKHTAAVPHIKTHTHTHTLKGVRIADSGYVVHAHRLTIARSYEHTIFIQYLSRVRARTMTNKRTVKNSTVHSTYRSPNLRATCPINSLYSRMYSMKERTATTTTTKTIDTNAYRMLKLILSLRTFR